MLPRARSSLTLNSDGAPPPIDFANSDDVLLIEEQVSLAMLEGVVFGIM